MQCGLRGVCACVCVHLGGLHNGSLSVGRVHACQCVMLGLGGSGVEQQTIGRRIDSLGALRVAEAKQAGEVEAQE